MPRHYLLIIQNTDAEKHDSSSISESDYLLSPIDIISLAT